AVAQPAFRIMPAGASADSLRRAAAGAEVPCVVKPVSLSARPDATCPRPPTPRWRRPRGARASLPQPPRSATRPRPRAGPPAGRQDWSTQPSLTPAHRPTASRVTRDAQAAPGGNLTNRTVRQGHGSADGETVRACARRDAAYARRALPAQPHHRPAAL